MKLKSHFQKTGDEGAKLQKETKKNSRAEKI
jgi:hypothetical protein